MRYKMYRCMVVTILHKQGHRHTSCTHGNVGMLQIHTFSCLSCPCHIRLHTGTYRSTLTHVEDFEIKLSIICVHILSCPAPPQIAHEGCEWIRIVLLLLKNAVHQKWFKRHRNSHICFKSEYYIFANHRLCIISAKI